MKLRLLCLAMLALLGGPMGALAGPIEEGLDAYRRQDYQGAFGLWQPLAEKGDPVAQYQLGTLYAEGKGIGQNDATAAMWFERSATQGNANAQYNLGASYAEGLGVTKDEAVAVRWFKRAAEQGMAYAQLNLGILYATGRGTPVDNVESVKWLELAILALPPGGARSDAARMLKEAADKLTEEQLLEARVRERAFRPKPEAR